MTERPILFSAPMVLALLAGTKTQTRRVVKPQPFWLNLGDNQPNPMPRCRYGAAGDRLWVRETWAPCEAAVRKGSFQYAADGAVGLQIDAGGSLVWRRNGHTSGISDRELLGMWVGKPTRWKPSIHMPRGVSRITLDVKAVRIERLQAITEADACAEGIVKRDSAQGGNWVDHTSWSKGRYRGCVYNARDSYMTLWESINGAGSWALNPWVWVVEFKLVTP